MERQEGRFSRYAGGFPLDCETLEMIQEQGALAMMLGNLGGDKVILSGCEERDGGTRREEGYVFVRTEARPEGEILRWSGGAVADGMRLVTAEETIEANGVTYPGAYVKRYLTPGVADEDEEHWDWEEFSEIPTLREVAEALRAKEWTRLEIVGTVKPWAWSEEPGRLYLWCEGQQLRSDQYPELYSAIGERYACVSESGIVNKGYFRLPDMRGGDLGYVIRARSI